MRKFALRFSGAVEGLGYNDAALKDLLNSALEEPPNWWRMRGLEHLIFGEFVDFLESAPGDHRVRSESPQSPLLKWWFSAPPWWPPALPAPPWHPCPPLLPGPLPLHGPGPTIPLSDPPPTHPPPRHYLVLVCGASRIRSLKANVFQMTLCMNGSLNP